MFKDLLDIESDQEFIVEDQASFACDGRLDVHNLTLTEMELFLLVWIESGGI